MYVCDEAIALPRYALYKKRIVCFVAEVLAQLPDGIAESIFEIDEGFESPHFYSQVLARN